MRRALAISLILFFSIGPLSALLGESDDPSVPACCRRHGEHHCATAAKMASLIEAASGNASLTAPLTCPLFPRTVALAASSTQAFVPEPVALPILLAEYHSPLVARASARISQIRTRADRGPPSLL